MNHQPSHTTVLGDRTNKMETSGSILGGKAKQQQQPAAKAKAEPQPKPAATVIEPPAAVSSVEIVEFVAMTETDKANEDNAEYAVEYIADIFENLRADETAHFPQPGYLEKQTQVNPKMRAILVDWLVDVHRKYKLRRTTLFLAVNLIDRFLEKRDTLRKHLQLVGVTSLLIAAKYEEVYPPQINDFVYVTDNAYSKKEIIDMEITILSTLDFNICRPLPATFLERYQQVNGCTEAHKDLAAYLLELSLIEYKMIKYSPSHIAAAAILLSNKLLQRRPSWTPSAVKHTKMTEAMLKECAKEMCGLLESVESNQLQAVRKKFSQLKYHAVAKLNFAAAPRSNLASNDGLGRTYGREAGQRRPSSGSTHMHLSASSVIED